MKCLVVGGGGFLGSHLCAGLLSAGHVVRVLELKGAPRRPGQSDDRIEWREGDFSVGEGVKDAVAGMDAVFHLACTTLPQTSNLDPARDVASNVVPSLRLLDACVAEKVGRFVFFSSGGTVYGIPRDVPIAETHPTEPICSYGVQKLAVEKYVALYRRLHGLSGAVLRISNPYGPGQNPNSGQGVVTAFLHRVSRGEPVEIWGDGSVVRDYVFVGDVVSAALAAAAVRPDEWLFNVGSGAGLSLLDVLKEVEVALGRRAEVVYKPARIVDVPRNVLDVGLVRRVLGWRPTVSFPEGVRRCAAVL